MDGTNSILDKVLENKQIEDLFNFDPEFALKILFSELSDREKDVLVRRFGLSGNMPQTLEIIGQEFGVTRERVRQIETGSIRKLRQSKAIEDELRYIETVIHQLLEKHGGIMEENHLLEMLLSHREYNLINQAILLFFIEKLLSSKFDSIKRSDHLHKSWKIITIDENEIIRFIDRLIKHIDDHGQPIDEDDFIQNIVSSLEDSIDEFVVRGHMRVSKKMKQNIFGKWGRSHWNSITPKRMNDKIYLVLQSIRKPLHFKEIAEKINELKFDHKVAYPATVHNELILDNKYVLVGRGIYALKEWGYEPGVVADVIQRILEDSERPLSRDEIVEKVLERRIVGKSTIHLSLMNKDKFQRMDNGKYSLKQ